MYNFSGVSVIGIIERIERVFCSSYGKWHAIYNVIRFCRHEKLFLEKFHCISIYILTGYGNTCTFITTTLKKSSESVHDVQNYRDTLFQFPCMMLCCVYENHEVLQNFIGLKDKT